MTARSCDGDSARNSGESCDNATPQEREIGRCKVAKVDPHITTTVVQQSTLGDRLDLTIVTVNLQETKARVEVARLHKEGARKEQGGGGISAGDNRWAAWWRTTTNRIWLDDCNSARKIDTICDITTLQGRYPGKHRQWESNLW